MAYDIYAWGSNVLGAFGVNNAINKSTPLLIGAASRWINGPVGANAALAAIDTTNNIFTWGWNPFGQLGTNDVASRSTPIQITSDGAWSKVNSGNCLIAIKNDGTLWGCGDNSIGTLGVNDVANRSSLVQISSATDWAYAAISGQTLFVLKNDGTLWGCGRNNNGALGIGTAVSFSSLIQIGTDNTWTTNLSSSTNSLAIKKNGTLWATGQNTAGAVGVNTAVNVSSWTQVGAATDWVFCDTQNFSLGIRSGGSLFLWGQNNLGQLGQGDVVNRSSPVQLSGTWSKAVCVNITGVGIKTDGSLWCWGGNAQGAIGNNTVVNRSSPVQTSLGGNDWGNVINGYCVFAFKGVPPTVTPSPTISPTPTSSATPTPSNTPSPTPSETPSPTPSESPSPTPSESPSPTPSESPSPTPSESPTPTPSDTPSPSPSESPTPTPTPSDSPMPTAMPIPSLSPTATPGPISYYYYTLIDCGETYNKVGRSIKQPADLVSTPQWFVGPNLCFTINGYATGPAYDYDLDASTSAPINGCTDPLCSPPVIAPTAATNFVTSTLLPNADGYDFYNQGTGAGSLALTFQNSSGSAQAVFVSLFNQSNQTMIISVNGVNYPVYPGQSFSQTITLKAGNYISISSAVPSLYTSATVYGQIYVARPSECAYIANLTPATRAVEGDEGSLDTSVVNGVSQQRNAYITITENGDQVKVIETSVDDHNCFNTNIQTLPDVIPVLASGFPQF